MNRLLTAKTAVTVRTSGWALSAGAFAVAVIVLLICYWQTVQSLIWVWGHDGTYQYAYLIFPLSLWTAFNLRRPLRAAPPKPSIWGVPVLAVLVCVWYVGHLLDINLPQHFALVGMFPALVLALWGWRALRILAFPLGYLVFAVPWGDALVGPLQDITAHLAVRALELTGTPVLLNGREIITPSAAWMVADACSGVKFFIACSALGCLYAYLMYRRWWKRLLFVVLAAVVPVIANGFRVYFTVLIGDTWGLKYATGTDHMIFGWQFFGTVLLLLLLAGWFFRDRLVTRNNESEVTDKLAGIRTVIWLPAIGLLVAGPLLAAAVTLPAAPGQYRPLTAPVVRGWLGPQAVSGNWRPVFRGATAEFQAAYRMAVKGDALEMFHAVYTGVPRRGHNLITYGNNVYDPAQSNILSSTAQRVELTGGRWLTAAELRIADIGGSRLVWYWYCVDRHCTDSPAMTKLLQAWDVLRGHVPQSSVWALSSPVANGSVDGTRESLRDFARALPMSGEPDSQAQRPFGVSGNGP